MHALASSLGIADRLAFVSQIPSVQMPNQYHQMDVLVLPSLTWPNWKEQFGRVLIEAMASGVPVIGSDSGAIPGVVADAGLIVPEGDIDALKNAIAQIRDDTHLHQRLREVGRMRALQHYTHQQIATQTVAVYRQMMSYSNSTP